MKSSFKCSRTIGILVLCTILSAGCGKNTSVLIEEETGNPENSIQFGEKEGYSEKTEAVSQESIPQEKEAAPEQELIYVDVCGAVNAPGVYQLPAGSRIFQAVEMAGGFSGEAAVEMVNQADVLDDGQQIRIYTREEAEEFTEKQTLMRESSLSDGGAVAVQSDGKVDINQADKETLMTLTGIGETRAEAILAYREANGGFSVVEDLMLVEGIKEKTYEKLKDEITVN